MNICLRFWVALFMLIGFGAAYAASTETTSLVTYTVVKGDTLSIIAKKFPGTTWQMLAKRNNITNANLIYPNTVLHVEMMNSALKTSVKKTQKITLKTAVVNETICDLTYGLDRLQFPQSMRSVIKAKSLIQEHQAASLREQIYFANEGSHQYVFGVSKHCVYTKIIRNTVFSESREELRDRLVVGTSLENHATSPPETTPGHITTQTQEVIGTRLSSAEGKDDFEVRRISIRRFLYKYVGPPHDLERMQKILQQQMYPDSYQITEVLTTGG